MIANEIRALIDLIGIENIKTLVIAAIVYNATCLVIILLVAIVVINIMKRMTRNRR